MESSPDTQSHNSKSIKPETLRNVDGKPSSSKSKDLIEQEHSSTEESEESEEETCDIDFPRDNANELHQFLHRELNNLSNLEDPMKRKFALIKMYQIFVQAKNKAPNKIYQELLPLIQKPLFKRLSDKVEKCRELAGLIIKEFFVRSDDLTLSIPYLMPILIERLNAEDLEGTEGLPDVMKPPITQKPQVMVEQVEPSEEVRLVLAEIVTVIVSSTVFDCLRAYIDQIVNILRALCMDPYGGVIIEGCQAMSEFAQNGGDQLLHFAENMGRSLFTAFVNKHAKVRIAGLNALYHVLYCGVWKFNANIMEHIIGFRDPNLVPIKEFYESTTKLNYFAMFVADRSIAVRSHFYRTMCNLLIKLPDKKDHEGRVFPYIISGLYDENDGIRETVYEMIEEMGKQYEEEYEKDIRELKQLGFNPEWSFDGKIKDSDIILPLPFLYRPCLGSRILVRSYVRRYLHAIYKELTDWIQENRERASNLLLCCIIYTEDFMTQFLDHLLVALYKVVLEKENKIVMKNVPLSCKLLGRYCAPRTYGPLILQAIKNELASYYPHTQVGALKSFGYFFAGAVEIYPKGETLDKISELLGDFIKAIQSHVLDSLDAELSDSLVDTLSIMVDSLIQKQEKGLDVTIWQKYEKDVFSMIMRALGVYNNYKLINKPEPEHISGQKSKCIRILNSLSLLSKDPESDFFDSHVCEYFQEEFWDTETIEKCRDMASLSHKWRMFYVVFDLIDGKQLTYYIDKAATTTVFERIGSIFKSILSNGEAKNYPVKNIVLNYLFPSLVNKSMKFISENASNQYMQILTQAFKTTWSTPDENSKQYQNIFKLISNLIDCKAIVLSDKNLEAFDQMIIGFDIFYKEKKEQSKIDLLVTIQKLLGIFENYYLKDKKYKDKQDEVMKLKCMTSITDEIIKFLTDYYDNVREQAQLLLKFIVSTFMADEIKFNDEQDDLLQMLRANTQIGWGNAMKTQLKEAAELESDLNKHLFNDPQQFLKNIIAIMMDETHGRDNLIWIIKEFNKKSPFMMLNDFRIAQSTNAVRRVEILREVIFK